MSLRQLIAVALLSASTLVATDAVAAPNPRCEARARHASSDARIRLAVDEARRQHKLFGGQAIERNGGMFRVGYSEAESGRPAGESAPTWERVATFWRALAESEPPSLITSVGQVERSEVASSAASGASASRTEVAVREALLRASIVDTPWSAAFISYLMKTAGFSRTEFEYSDSHSDYVRAALETSESEAAGREATHVFRACDVATTPPRAGDLICATRSSTAGTARFEALSAAMATRAGQPFPMHCDIVVRSDEGGDAKIETIGGNVVNSVTLARMTLNARKVLSDAYIRGATPAGNCAPGQPPCREHLSRRPWLVLLQFRN